MVSYAHYQLALDKAIRQLGGYWPALAGLARILEELGELASESDPIARRNEAADCTVATLAIANQYCVPLVPRPPDTKAFGERRALIAGGQLARLVNRFEGVKPPKPNEPNMPTLPDIIGDLISGLAECVEAPVEELVALATATAKTNAERDAGRFVARVDAITADSRDKYWSEIDSSSTQLTPVAGLWGVYGDRNTWRSQVERFLRVDAIHPLVGLIFGSIDLSVDRDHLLQEIATWVHCKHHALTMSATCITLHGSVEPTG